MGKTDYLLILEHTDCHKKRFVALVFPNIKSPSILVSETASHGPFLAALYSASIEERETSCFLLANETAPVPNTKYITSG